ncbi:transposase-like protein [Verticillium dahliae]
MTRRSASNRKTTIRRGLESSFRDQAGPRASVRTNEVDRRLGRATIPRRARARLPGASSHNPNSTNALFPITSKKIGHVYSLGLLRASRLATININITSEARLNWPGRSSMNTTQAWQVSSDCGLDFLHSGMRVGLPGGGLVRRAATGLAQAPAPATSILLPRTTKSPYEDGRHTLWLRNKKPVMHITDHELETYLRQPTQDVEEVGQWWLDRREIFVTLGKLALDIWAIPAMASDCQRPFSSAKNDLDVSKAVDEASSYREIATSEELAAERHAGARGGPGTNGGNDVVVSRPGMA